MAKKTSRELSRKIYQPITNSYPIRFKMPNRLASESSPYLLQHAENPVEWYPWSEEALAKARAENKPIFLSIGYSACHWCHVMEHESFENDTIARFLNENFVAIKVDREERPDLDQIYMQAVMALQRGQGGWPLSAFLTPDGNVFFGGTYWPPQDSRGMPGFDRVLRGVLQAFQTQRDQVEEQSGKVTEYLRSINVAGSSDHTLEFDRQTLLDVGESLQRIFDFQNGGFGRAPKFPHAMDLQVLMRLQYYDATAKPNDTTEQARELPWLKMVNLNLEKMALGGIYDHLGGGFARYSVDEHWLVPHFEKMLYDNALLSDAYLDAYTLSGNELFRQRAVETFDYQLRYMTDPAGGFHSTEDADSEGVEGKFYVWSRQEIMDVLGDADGETFCHVYNVTAGGNFEGRNILNLSRPLEHLAELRDYDSDLPALMAKCRDRLLAVRDQRIRPGKDDKILVSWNAMMIHSLAKGGRILNNADYFQAAVNAARFIECEMRQQDGVGLFHTWRHGKAKFSAFLDDYACLINALMTLFECSGDLSWLRWAKELTDHVIDEFLDSTGAGFFFTSRSSEKLIARTKDIQDSSVPSGNGMMVCALNRLYRLTEKQHYRELAESTAALGQELLKKAPSAAGQMVSGMDQLTSVGQEIVIFAHENQSDAILESIHSVFHPNRIVCPVLDSPSTEPLAMSLLAGKQMLQNQPTVYICENYACQSPLTGMKSIKEFFEERK